MLTEWTEGLPVRTFDYDSAGRLAQARVLTLTTRFTYDGNGARRVVEVVGHGTTTYTLDYGRGNRILAEETVTGTLLYLYGRDCLGQYEGAEDEWLYYLNDATGYVRQGADEQGEVVSSWLFDPDGTMLEGPQGLVSHLICGGVYDWSTGLIFKGRGYFDPNLGIWLALVPLVMIQSWRGRKRKRRRGMPWYVVAIFVCVGVGGMLTGCGGNQGPKPEACTTPPQSPLPTPSPTPPPPNRDLLQHAVTIEVVQKTGYWTPYGSDMIKTTIEDPDRGFGLGTVIANNRILTHNHFDEERWENANYIVLTSYSGKKEEIKKIDIDANWTLDKA